MAKTKPSYFPLRLVYNYDMQDEEGSWRYEQRRDEYEKRCKADLPPTPMQFIGDMSMTYAMAIRDKKTLKKGEDYSSVLLMETISLMKRMGYNTIEHKKTYIADAMDILIFPFVLDIWTHNKQVYKPDEYFAKALLNTKNLELRRQDIEHLPTNVFFIDLTDVKCTRPYEGIFLSITPAGFVGAFINIFLMASDPREKKSRRSEKSAIYSHYFFVRYDENGSAAPFIQSFLSEKEEAEKEAQKVPGYSSTIMGASKDGFFSTENFLSKAKFSRLDMVLFVFQLLCYLTSKEPDIAESPVTRGTYRKPAGKPKNTFSEVQQHDVGVRYGKSIRTRLRENDAEEKRRRKTQKRAGNADDEQEKNVRKSPIPHFRSAHWQRYWVGEGRKQLVTKWIEQVYVGFGNRNNKTDVVIHKVL